MVSFTANTKALFAIIKQMQKIRGKSMYQIKDTCELTVSDNVLTLSMPGSTLQLGCVTKGTVKATIEFRKFASIVESHSFDEITAEFYDEGIKFGLVEVRAKTSISLSGTVPRSIRLPHKYNQLDLLDLVNKGYTEQELEFNNLVRSINEAQVKLKVKISQAAKPLKGYGISEKALEDFVMNEIAKALQ